MLKDLASCSTNHEPETKRFHYTRFLLYMCLLQVLFNVNVRNKNTSQSFMHKYIRSTILEVVASVVVLYEAILQHPGRDSTCSFDYITHRLCPGVF